ncbi:MAG: orotidine-5'-phosphate decarboxylase [Chitinophagales bacterium]
MTRKELIEQIHIKKSFLCVGLDTDITKIPTFLLDFEDPVFEFNKRIIDATKQYCIAYKPNIAFYESMGSKGWDSLKKTVDYIPKNIFTIADAKRGDIGNTSKMYAKTFFETYNFDAVTIAPYMGEDSVTPFLNSIKNKWCIILALTSNKGSADFQYIKEDGKMLYQKVIEKSMEWGNDENIMFVTGATRAKELKLIREQVPTVFFLVPGVGAQGGSVKDVVENALIKDDIGLIINSSRSIIYADNTANFAIVAGKEAKKLQEQMAVYL